MAVNSKIFPKKSKLDIKEDKIKKTPKIIEQDKTDEAKLTSFRFTDDEIAMMDKLAYEIQVRFGNKKVSRSKVIRSLLSYAQNMNVDELVNHCKQVR